MKHAVRFIIAATFAALIVHLPLFGTTFKVKEQITKEDGKTKLVDAVLLVDADAVRINDKIFNRETVKTVQYSFFQVATLEDRPAGLAPAVIWR